jgi:hypothetical protein
MSVHKAPLAACQAAECIRLNLPDCLLKQGHVILSAFFANTLKNSCNHLPKAINMVIFELNIFQIAQRIKRKHIFCHPVVGFHRIHFPS